MRKRPLFVAALGSILLAACATTSEDADSTSSSIAKGSGGRDLLVLPALGGTGRSIEAKDDDHTFAESADVSISPGTMGVWDSPSPDIRRWRLTIERGNSLSQNLGFTRYWMPRDGQLRLLDATNTTIATFTDKDNKPHRQLWTPIVPGTRVTIEVTVPTLLAPNLDLSLTKVNSAFRGFAARTARSGDCNRDVVCPEGDAWRDQIRSAAVISLGGSRMCSGTLVNDTSNDGRMFFLTANHCTVRENNAASLVVYWNYQTTTCGGRPDGSLAQFQTGSTFRARADASDFTLVELDDLSNPAFDVYFTGWDATDTVPTSAVCIHHPNVDEKRISFENDPLSATDYLGDVTPGDGTHLRITDWDVGTTEPGSSGSGLWNPQHRLVGQLHGGYAACGNDKSDWFGWFNKSFDTGTTPDTRAKDWLDATNSGKKVIDGSNACARATIDFTSTPNPANVNATVTTTATVTGGTAPYAYAWDLNGDGTIDCTKTTCAQAFPQEYDGDVRLTVTDATGCVSIAHHAQTVVDPNLCSSNFDATGLPLAIPDNTPAGITSTIDVPTDGVAAKAKISVKIKHPYIGDLKVTLNAPSGKSFVIHDRSGGATDDIDLVDFNLPALSGEPMKGKWTLAVSDNGKQDVGTLDSWRLTLRAPCSP